MRQLASLHKKLKRYSFCEYLKHKRGHKKFISGQNYKTTATYQHPYRFCQLCKAFLWMLRPHVKHMDLRLQASGHQFVHVDIFTIKFQAAYLWRKNKNKTKLNQSDLWQWKQIMLNSLMSWNGWLVQGSRLPSPLIENDLKKCIWDLKHLTCQVPFYLVFRRVVTKFPNFTKVGLEITTALPKCRPWLVHIMACCLFNAKPLPEPMVTFLSNGIPQEQNSFKFW